MENITLLESNQIFGDDTTKPLKIFRRYGIKAAVTDFSILLGCYVDDTEHTPGGTSLADRTTWWWTSTTDRSNDAFAVTPDGGRGWSYVY